MSQTKNVQRTYISYTAKSIAGMIGVSVYILADTFFISRSGGADGITVLNLVLPLYGLIYAIGAMAGIGASIAYSLDRAMNKAGYEYYLGLVCTLDLLLAIPFCLLGLFCPGLVLKVMGADKTIIAAGRAYTATFLPFAPLFMWNYALNGFTRNDGETSLAMAASLAGSLFNIVFDYIFIFPMGMGIQGAALATGLSPAVNMGVIFLYHQIRKHPRTIRFAKGQSPLPDFRFIKRIAGLGFSAFVGEIAPAITTAVFNFLILGLSGNTGVAAYGIIANVALVVSATFNGTALGAQPLFSDAHGKGNEKEKGQYLRYALFTILCLAGFFILLLIPNPNPVIHIFNSESDELLRKMACQGFRLYGIGFLFAGLNILYGAYFASTGRTRESFVISILRGVVLISICAFCLSELWGMQGVWLGYPAAEGLTAIAVCILNRRKKRSLPASEIASE